MFYVITGAIAGASLVSWVLLVPFSKFVLLCVGLVVAIYLTRSMIHDVARLESGRRSRRGSADKSGAVNPP